MNCKRQRLGVTALVVLSSIILACSDDEHGSNSVDVAVLNGSIHIPGALGPGYTTFKIRAESDGDNHLLFIRAKDGVTKEAMTKGIHANDGSGDALVTIVGGNGGMPKGTQADVTFKLDDGIYAVVLFDDEGDLSAASYFSVEDGNDETSPPDAHGVVQMGPGFVFSVPQNFDGSGTFEFRNPDEQTHEAAFIRLTVGATIDDVVRWARDGFQGLPPFEPAGGFGALDGGRKGWLTFDLSKGNYAIICWIPGPDGLPHWLNGMFASFSVE